MNRIREIDTENQVAVVEPGRDARAAQRRAALRSASSTRCRRASRAARSAATSATNAGGMRAVRYGVTRHHVLGPRGRCWPTAPCCAPAGKFVKCSTRLRPDAAAHRLRGHAGRHDRGDGEAAAPAHRRRHRPGPFRDPGRGDPRRAADRGQRHQPVHPRVRRRARSWAASPRRPDSTSASPRTSRRARWPISSSSSRGMDADRLDEDVEQLGTLLEDLGALDVYVLPPHAGAAAHRGPGAGVLRRQGGRVPTTSSTPSSPGPPSPTTWPGWPSWHSEHGAFVIGLRPRRRRQRAPRRLPARRRAAARPHAREIFERRSTSGAPSRASTASARRSCRTSSSCEDPVVARAHALHQAGLRPAGHPRPGPAARR